MLREWCVANGRVVSADGSVDAETAAAILERSVSTLTNWRAQGLGPAYRRGGRIRYRLVDLAQYMDRGIAE
jgi:phage terminase Nu1 subunit (DNA packaging protein)